MTLLTDRVPPPTPAARTRRLGGRARRLLLVAASIASLAAAASCGSSGGGTSSDPAPSDEKSAPDKSAKGSGGGAGNRKLPDACDVIVIQDWEAITALALSPPQPDTGSAAGTGTVCSLAADGTQLPYLFTVQIAPVGSPGSVANLATFLDDYARMEEVDGIGDRALYWDQDTTYQGDAVADHPMVAFEAGDANVTITLNADGLGRSELEQLAKAVADQI